MPSSKMQSFEEPQAAAPESPAQARATAQEFAAAVAALEARRAEDLSGPPVGAHAGTVDIGEAVRELGLEDTPEDVWAEVQAQRLRREAGESSARRTQAAPPQAARRSAWLRRSRVPRVVAGLACVFTCVLVGGQVIGGHLRHQTSVGGGVVHAPQRSLDRLPDGVPVYVTDADVSNFLHEKKPSQMFAVRNEAVDNRWVLIRHDGKLYLRGYVLPQPAQPGYLERLSLYSANGVGDLTGRRAQAVTIPLAGAHWKDGRGTDGWSEITLTNVQTDGHFRDEW